MALKSLVLALALLASAYGQGRDTNLLSQVRRRTQAQAIGSICSEAVKYLSSSIRIPTGLDIDYQTIRTPCINTDIVNDAAEGVQDAAERARQGAQDAAEGAAQGVQDAAEGAAQGVQDAAEGAAQGVQNAAEGAAQGVQEAVDRFNPFRRLAPVVDTCENKVPKGASIKWDEKSLSSMIGGDVTRTLEASCECFELADEILREGLQNSFESVDHNEAVSAALTSGLKVQNCLIDLGLNVQEPDKDNVLAEIRDSRGATVSRVAELEEIDLAFYQKIVGLGAACVATGSTCDQLINEFRLYLENSADRLADEFVALKDDIVDRINTVTSAVTDRMNVLERVPQLLRKTRADLEACTSETQSSVEQSSIAQLNEMAAKIERLTTLMDTVPAVLDALQAAKDLYKLMNYRETIAEAISSGRAPDLPSMVEGLKGGTKVAGAFEQVKTLFTDFDDVLFDVTLLESIPENQMPSGLEDCMRRRGENAFMDLDTASLAVPDVREMADKIIVTNLEVRGGVASYSRFIDISVPMPCSRMEDKCFEVKEIGFKQCVDWPEFYECTYEKEVPLPNHHIPWVGFYLYTRNPH
ncbi:unnamed protein product [Vitrella brassicaformis CCMP3155]|uniref:Uncharacterized protein n=1 Tax=Vitrella brassicaformis (strain CCMP3155) TaxID=1169540 RepID=A0A0G4EWY9_VITBC|nr:unnamed protein product [Vitrella brassicaformis CCMP3155]|eukprot:CEM03507.1 unnamed protein product [Vitrella brassicaformis CCMP3155]